MTVLTMSGKEIDWSQDLDPTMMVKWSYLDTGYDTVRGSLRTIAHLDQTSLRSEKKFGKRILVIQPPYNTGVAASEGTHDKDVCLDFYIPGVSWWTQQRFWRWNGGWGWYRHPPLFGNHVHGGCLPIPKGGARYNDFATEVGVYVPGQLVDYYNHAFGLSGQHTPGSDKSWFPKNIDATVFDLNKYIQKKREENMEFKDWSPESKREFVNAILGAPVVVRKSQDRKDGLEKITVKQAIARGANAPMITKESEEDIKEAIAEADAKNL